VRNKFFSLVPGVLFRSHALTPRGLPRGVRASLPEGGKRGKRDGPPSLKGVSQIEWGYETRSPHGLGLSLSLGLVSEVLEKIVFGRMATRLHVGTFREDWRGVWGSD